MDHFEVVVQGELFRISEQTQPDGAMSYDFVWLNGPAEGTYGFTMGRSSDCAAEKLVAQIGQFLEAFYGPGGIREMDFPDHAPASEHNDTQ